MRGGGGKGMRIAMTADEFDAQLESAKVIFRGRKRDVCVSVAKEYV